MLSEGLPIYSGGLGNVAGDQLKAASNLGVPVTGIGLLYQQGYFRQEIDAQGQQQALYPFNDPGQLPITPLASQMANGSAFNRLSWHQTLDPDLASASGQNKLYLLDTNDPANVPVHSGASPPSCTGVVRNCV